MEAGKQAPGIGQSGDASVGYVGAAARMQGGLRGGDHGPIVGSLRPRRSVELFVVAKLRRGPELGRQRWQLKVVAAESGSGRVGGGGGRARDTSVRPIE